MDFTSTVRELSKRGSQLVATPAWDFSGTENIHAQMSRFRAIEGGFALARCAQEGRLDLWDAFGRSLASTATRGHEAELLVQVPLGPGATIYSRIGDAGILAILLTMAAASLAMMVNRARQGPPSASQ